MAQRAAHQPDRCHDLRVVSPDLRSAIQKFNRDERLELLDEVWSLVRNDGLPFPASHAEELRRRLDAADSDAAPDEPPYAIRR